MSSLNTSYANVQITAIKAFNDNYLWAIVSKNNAALVDPGDAAVCIKFLEENQLILNTILITHHHGDHTGGIKELMTYCQQKQWPLTIFGPANEKIAHCDVKLIQGDVVNLTDLSMKFDVIDLPGHTSGHIAYFSKEHTESILFCGDTLFSGGCGRLFEGTPKQMHNSLTKLANLPENTKVYCAHEYTQANLKFALTVDPDNSALIDYSNHVNALRENGKTTIPTTIKLEKQINPFLRTHTDAIKVSALQFDNSSQTSAIDTFATIRRWKDQF